MGTAFWFESVPPSLCSNGHSTDFCSSEVSDISLATVAMHNAHWLPTIHVALHLKPQVGHVMSAKPSNFAWQDSLCSWSRSQRFSVLCVFFLRYVIYNMNYKSHHKTAIRSIMKLPNLCVCVSRIGAMYRKARKVLHPDASWYTGEAGTSPPSCQRDVWSSLADGSRMTTKDGLKP